MIEYHETITNDSAYESDSAVLHKYAAQPLNYIWANDQRALDRIGAAAPIRIAAARVAKGKRATRGDLYLQLKREAANKALNAVGFRAGMSDATRMGTSQAVLDQAGAVGFAQQLVDTLQEEWAKNPSIF